MRSVVLGIAVLALGCGPEAGLRLEVNAASGLVVGPGGDLDAVRVEVVASQGPEAERPYTCRAVGRTFPEVGELELPVVVVVVPGAIPWRCVGFRATGLRGGDEVLVAEEAVCASFEGVATQTLWLAGPCLSNGSTAVCSAGEVCRAEGSSPSCVPSAVAGMLEAVPVLDGSCDGTEGSR